MTVIEKNIFPVLKDLKVFAVASRGNDLLQFWACSVLYFAQHSDPYIKIRTCFRTF